MSAVDFPILDDKGVLSVVSVITQIWKNRSNTVKVCKLCELLTESCDESMICAEMEMYLPQLCHFAVTLGKLTNVRVDDALEKLLMSMCQVSMHASFRIRFMLGASLEDYQPENPDGTANDNKDDYLFYRCARLLQNLERCVAYGSPLLLASDEKSILEAHGREVMVESTVSERKSRLNKILVSNNSRDLTREDKGAPLSRLRSIDGAVEEGCNGFLLFKRAQRKAVYSTHKWKWRYFRIEQGVLFCSRTADCQTARGGIMRAMALAGSSLSYGKDAVEKGSTKHPFYFLVKNFSSGFEFHLRAETEEICEKWKVALIEECQSNTSFPYPLPADRDSPEELPRTLALRRKRWLAFAQQMKFVNDITDICERLRFIERPLRPAFMVRDIKRLKIPPFAYIPLANSNDTFSYILRAVPEKAYAFRTKARCPMLMYFETEQHASQADIATFLSSELHEYSDQEILLDVKDVTVTADEGEGGLVATDSSGSLSSDEHQGPIEPAPSRLKMDLHPAGPWRDTGTGLSRVAGLSLKPELTLSPKLSAAEPPSSRRKDRRCSSSHFTVEEEVTMRDSSPYSHLKNWGLEGFIAKSNDDLRQEMFVMQMITYFRGLFEAESDKLWLKSYQVMNTSQRTGMIQLIKRSSSLDATKKSENFPGTLRKLFVQRYGNEQDSSPDQKPGKESEGLKKGIMNFVYSMAASSIVSYLLAIKDRHNGNVMLDDEGHIIHIDFGFVFGLAPGKAFSMETCPFKLTEEMVDVMGGPASPHFELYKKLCADAYVIATSHSETLCSLVDMMSANSPYPCFQYNPNAAAQFRRRCTQMEGKTRFEVDQFVEGLVNASHGHAGTMLYDDFQVLTNGIKK